MAKATSLPLDVDALRVAPDDLLAQSVGALVLVAISNRVRVACRDLDVGEAALDNRAPLSKCLAMGWLGDAIHDPANRVAELVGKGRSEKHVNVYIYIYKCVCMR